MRVLEFLLVIIELLSLGVTSEALRAKIGWKSSFSKERSQFSPKFRVQGVVHSSPANPFFLSQNWNDWHFLWYKNFGRSFFRFVTVHAFHGQTHRRTDGQLHCANTALHGMQRGKNIWNCIMTFCHQ